MTASRGLERVTVNLTPRSSDALEEAVNRTGDTKTDTINRAVQIYNYLDALVADGGEVLIRRPASDEAVLLPLRML